MTKRLIESWLPIAAVGEESVRERRSMTALPPTYYLHVWWARRPLVASRAAILASLLPEDANDWLSWLIAQPQATVLSLLAYCTAQSVDLAERLM